MNKILGLDIGDKRIGVALADKDMVVPWGIIDNSNLNQAVGEIIKICRSQEVKKIVIGMPKFQKTLQADKIHKFAIELTKNLNLEITYVDETLTSHEAERQLGNTKLKPATARYKKEIDKISAQLILKQYLSSCNHKSKY